MLSLGFFWKGNMETVVVDHHERRQFVRRANSMPIEVRVGAYKETLKTRNYSQGGLFVETSGKAPLTVRTIVCLTEENSETVLGRVVWVAEDGMGIEFIDRSSDCCKPKACSADN